MDENSLATLVASMADPSLLFVNSSLDLRPLVKTFVFACELNSLTGLTDMS